MHMNIHIYMCSLDHKSLSSIGKLSKRLNMVSNIHDWLKINELKYLSRDMVVSIKTIKCSGLPECVSSFIIVSK